MTKLFKLILYMSISILFIYQIIIYVYQYSKGSILSKLFKFNYSRFFYLLFTIQTFSLIVAIRLLISVSLLFELLNIKTTHHTLQIRINRIVTSCFFVLPLIISMLTTMSIFQFSVFSGVISFITIFSFLFSDNFFNFLIGKDRDNDWYNK